MTEMPDGFLMVRSEMVRSLLPKLEIVALNLNYY